MNDQLSQKTIAVFDFDGTLTSKDTLKDFLIYNFGYISFFKGIISTSFILFLYILRIVDSHTAKETLFRHFFISWDEKLFNKACEDYSLTQIDQLIRPSGRTKIDWHIEQGHHLIIVSASLKNWITLWARKNGFADVIATEAEVEKGLLTGKFLTPNCKGEEKRRRFLKKFPNRDQYVLYVYGDSKGDKALLSIADKPFFRRFY